MTTPPPATLGSCSRQHPLVGGFAHSTNAAASPANPLTITKSMPRRIAVLTPFLLLLFCHVADAQLNEDRWRQLDQYLTEEAERFHLPGLSVAIVERGEVVHSFNHGAEITSDSSFLIGSCSKTITALAALLALKDADVDLDAPLTDVFSKVRIKGSKAPTLRQLLQHRSGLKRQQGFLELPSVEGLESQGFDLRLKAAPGRRYEYSNLNYALLGRVIEKVSDQTFCQFVRTRVFEPVGMESSHCELDATEADWAPEHQYLFGFPARVSPTRPPDSHVPAGFLRCSARDLTRLQICLLQDGELDGQQVFPSELVQLMRTPAKGAERGYGMGLVNGDHSTLGRLFAHEGATATSYSLHAAFPERQLAVAMLININLYDPFTDHGEAIYENVFRILAGEEPTNTRPYRIWFRWVLLFMVAFSVIQFTLFVIRWWRAGRPWHWPTTPRKRLFVCAQCVLPLFIWWFILRAVQVPFLQALKLDPDVMWSLVVLTAIGMASNGLKNCGSLPGQDKETPDSEKPKSE